MKRSLFTSALCLLLTAAASLSSEAAARSVRTNVLGLRLGMSKEAAHSRLRKIGQLDREDRKRQEVWKLQGDPHFAHVLIGFDREDRVRYVTAIARPEGQRMRYGEVADIKSARAEHSGNFYRYTWEAKASRNKRGHFLIVQGRDPQYLDSLSVEQSRAGGRDEEEEEERKPPKRP